MMNNNIMFKSCTEYPLYLVSSEGYLINKGSGNIVRGHQKKTGYVEVCIIGKDGEPQSVLLHRLVALAFCKRDKDKTEVNHINGNKDDNRAENLEWVTRAENLKHAFDTGLTPYNTTPKDVIATNMETGEQMRFSSIYKAAHFLGISQGNICMCCKGIRPSANGYIWEYANEN